MEKENTLNGPIGQVLGLDTHFDEFASCEDYISYCRIRDELNKFLINLNLSQVSQHSEDRIHHLYISLIHLDNTEKEIRSSDICEEALYLDRVFEKISMLKLMVMDYINMNG